MTLVVVSEMRDPPHGPARIERLSESHAQRLNGGSGSKPLPRVVGIVAGAVVFVIRPVR